MKHATPDTIATIADLLAPVRARTELTERKPGTFYRKTSAFLHFHEDPSGLFADVKLGNEWQRVQVDAPGRREVFLTTVESALRE